jgi:hypothetical protein
MLSSTRARARSTLSLLTQAANESSFCSTPAACRSSSSSSEANSGASRAAAAATASFRAQSSYVGSSRSRFLFTSLCGWEKDGTSPIPADRRQHPCGAHGHLKMGSPVHPLRSTTPAKKSEASVALRSSSGSAAIVQNAHEHSMMATECQSILLASNRAALARAKLLRRVLPRHLSARLPQGKLYIFVALDALQTWLRTLEGRWPGGLAAWRKLCGGGFVERPPDVARRVVRAAAGGCLPGVAVARSGARLGAAPVHAAPLRGRARVVGGGAAGGARGAGGRAAALSAGAAVAAGAGAGAGAGAAGSDAADDAAAVSASRRSSSPAAGAGRGGRGRAWPGRTLAVHGRATAPPPWARGLCSPGRHALAAPRARRCRAARRVGSSGAAPPGSRAPRLAPSPPEPPPPHPPRRRAAPAPTREARPLWRRRRRAATAVAPGCTRARGRWSARPAARRPRSGGRARRRRRAPAAGTRRRRGACGSWGGEGRRRGGKGGGGGGEQLRVDCACARGSSCVGVRVCVRVSLRERACERMDSRAQPACTGIFRKPAHASAHHTSARPPRAPRPARTVSRSQAASRPPAVSTSSV